MGTGYSLHPHYHNSVYKYTYTPTQVKAVVISTDTVSLVEYVNATMKKDIYIL